MNVIITFPATSSLRAVLFAVEWTTRKQQSASDLQPPNKKGEDKDAIHQAELIEHLDERNDWPYIFGGSRGGTLLQVAQPKKICLSSAFLYPRCIVWTVVLIRLCLRQMHKENEKFLLGIVWRSDVDSLAARQWKRGKPKWARYSE